MKPEITKMCAEINRALGDLEAKSNPATFVNALIAIAAERIARASDDREELCDGAQLFSETIYYGILHFGDKMLGLHS